VYFPALSIQLVGPVGFHPHDLVGLMAFRELVGSGASIDLLSVRGAEFIDFANPKQSWPIRW
jgi:hypothetical protein